MKRLFLFMASLCGGLGLWAQNPKILFALEPGADLEYITYRLGKEFEHPQRLCRNLPYFYCMVETQEERLLQQLKSIRGISAAQWNKQVQLRFNSNDPWFYKQEHLKLISADKAWDFQ
ncbi:MAG: hypothetical protein RLZZ370_501, partial [Bacteroidota bacterium]